MKNIILRRLVTFFVDGICFQLLAALILAIEYNCFSKEIAPLAENNLEFLVAIIMYYFILEYFFGRTIGKLVTNTKVVFGQGQNRLVQTIIRTLVRLIPLEPFSIFFNQDRLMWHDKISNTRVELIK